MGITNFGTALLDRYIDKMPVKTVLELGAQNLHHSDYSGLPYASEYYLSRGFTQYETIDLNGENNAHKLDLGKPINIGQFGLVTDFGTSEHVCVDSSHSITAFYNCIKNKHNACMVGGLIISENPKTGNWVEHGHNYYTTEFYKQLCEMNDYELLEVGEHPAMNNTIDGWHIYSVIRKKSDKPFCSFKDFATLPVLKS